MGILRRVIVEEGIAANVASVVLGPWVRSGFPGSPTILVDGEDLFPAKDHGALAL